MAYQNWSYIRQIESEQFFYPIDQLGSILQRARRSNLGQKVTRQELLDDILAIGYIAYDENTRFPPDVVLVKHDDITTFIDQLSSTLHEKGGSNSRVGASAVSSDQGTAIYAVQKSLTALLRRLTNPNFGYNQNRFETRNRLVWV